MTSLLRGLLVAVAAASTLSVAAPAAVASATSAAAGLTCQAKAITGSGGHLGYDVICLGGSFMAKVECIPSNGDPRYTHYGNRAGSGGTSTVWCAAGSNRGAWGAIAA